MRNIILLIALNLLGALHSATATTEVVSEGLTNRQRAINQLCLYARNLTYIPESMDELSRMGDLFERKKSSILESLQPLIASLPEDMRERFISFHRGITARVSNSFGSLLAKFDADYRNLSSVLVSIYSPDDTYIFFPHPLSTSSVVKGKEQEACDLVTKFLNSYEQLQKARVLLFGVGNIDRNHLIMFLTGTERIVINGENRDADKAILNLYAAYANPHADFETLRELEMNAAPYLIPDTQTLTVTTYFSIPYIPNVITPEAIKTKETLNKSAILRILATVDPAAQIARVFERFNAHLGTITDVSARAAKADRAIRLVTAGLAAHGVALPSV